MTVTAITALPVIMDVYRLMLMAVGNEGGALQRSQLLMSGTLIVRRSVRMFTTEGDRP